MWREFSNVHGVRILLNLNYAISVTPIGPTSSGEPAMVIRYSDELAYTVLGDAGSVLPNNYMLLFA